MDFKMNKLLKKIMRILLSLCLVQEVCADNVPDFQETLQAAKQGDAPAQYNLGLMYTQGQGVRQDYVEAVKWYRKAAEQGDAVAQYNLGLKYADGIGVRQDYVEAVKWYHKAAEQGLAGAKYNLGLNYAYGRGVRKDYV